MTATSPIRSGPPQVSADEAVARVADGATVAVTGSGGGVNEPDVLLTALERRFVRSGTPRGIAVYHPNGLGSAAGGGTECLAHDGFVRRVYGSHWSWAPQLSARALRGEFEIAVWPQGVLSQLLREAAGRRPALLSPVGLGTYLDPETEGQQRPGRQILPTSVRWEGRRWLRYPAPRVDVALIRATTADPAGNLTMEEEGTILDVLAAASAAKAAGGLVLAQVRHRTAAPADPQRVRVPGALVDALVVNPEQRQSALTRFNPAYCGTDAIRLNPSLPEDAARLLIAVRAARELAPGMVVNVGFGVADGVPRLAVAEGWADSVTFSIEQGALGGVPAWGDDFGLMWHPAAILDAPAVFDLYDGGLLDATVVSFAQVDPAGNVNVSYFGGRLIGPGGFINITGGARTVVFCGALTTGGMKAEIRGGRLVIVNEGRTAKFVPRCDQITFSAADAVRRGQRVLYVTERAVFRLGPDGVELTEVAAGLDAVADIVPAMGFRPRISPVLRHIDTNIAAGKKAGR